MSESVAVAFEIASPLAAYRPLAVDRGRHGSKEGPQLTTTTRALSSGGRQAAPPQPSRWEPCGRASTWSYGDRMATLYLPASNSQEVTRLLNAFHPTTRPGTAQHTSACRSDRSSRPQGQIE